MTVRIMMYTGSSANLLIQKARVAQWLQVGLMLQWSLEILILQ